MLKLLYRSVRWIIAVPVVFVILLMLLFPIKVVFDVQGEAAGKIQSVTVEDKLRIDEWLVDDGQRVKKGDPVVKLKITSAISENLLVLEQSVAEAKANYQRAKYDYKRLKKLYEVGGVSKGRFKKAELQLEAKEALLKKARHNLSRERSMKSIETNIGESKSVKGDSNHAIVHAPMSGVLIQKKKVVGRRQTQEGFKDVKEAIHAGSSLRAGEELFRIESPFTKTIEAKVPEAVYETFEKGRKLTLNWEGNPGSSFTGRVQNRSNHFERGKFLLEIQSDKRLKAGSGIKAEATFYHGPVIGLFWAYKEAPKGSSVTMSSAMTPDYLF